MTDWANRFGHERLAYVNRYDWGYHFYGTDDTARTLADIDPGAGWRAAIERSKQLSKANKYSKEGHPDHDRWDRIDKYRYSRIFLLDAAHTPEVIKVLARQVRLGQVCQMCFY